MKHKLLDWEEYQLLRMNIAQYLNTLIYHEPEKDLTNQEINRMNSSIYDILNIIGIGTSKDSSNMFYRKIELVGRPIRHSTFSKLYLLDPSTMPKKNIIDSILSWVDRGGFFSGNKYVNSAIIGLSKEDKEEYTIKLDSSFIGPFSEIMPTLAYGVHYTDYLEEM
jgi:hypothetical protein